MGTELRRLPEEGRGPHLLSEFPRRRFITFLLLAAAGLAIDLVSKSLVFQRLGLGGTTEPYFDGWMTFRLLTSMNEGALWGIGQGKTWLFALLSVVAVVGILVWLTRYGAIQSRWLTFALAMILAGTLGNLYDRAGLHGVCDAAGAVIYGVRDFLLFTFGEFHWPVFNFADCFLVTGAIMLGIQSIRAEQTAAGHDSPGEPGSDSAGPPEPTAIQGVTTG